MLRILSICLVLFQFCIAAGHSAEQYQLYTVPFRAGEGGYRLFRIPAISWDTGKPLLAFCEGRVDERRMRGNIDIVLRRSFDGGQTWGPLKVVADIEGDACGNPCVVRDPTRNRIWLTFTRSRGQDTEEQIVAGDVPGTRVYVTYSDDEGESWTAPREISSSVRKPDWGWYGTGPGNGLWLRNGKSGRLLIPAYHTHKGIYRTHVFYSDDHGETWVLGGIAAHNSSEPQVINDGRLVMNARTTVGKYRTLRESRDRGETWTNVDKIDPLIENRCQGDFLRCFRSGSQGDFDLIFTHPNSSGRTGVTAWVSQDEGASWPFAATLWRGPSAYTSMQRGHHGLIGILIECGESDVYQQIAFMKFTPEWVKTRAASER